MQKLALFYKEKRIFVASNFEHNGKKRISPSRLPRNSVWQRIMWAMSYAFWTKVPPSLSSRATARK